MTHQEMMSHQVRLNHLLMALVWQEKIQLPMRKSYQGTRRRNQARERRKYTRVMKR